MWKVAYAGDDRGYGYQTVIWLAGRISAPEVRMPGVPDGRTVAALVSPCEAYFSLIVQVD
jgi:hypothetical protein